MLMVRPWTAATNWMVDPGERLQEAADMPLALNGAGRNGGKLADVVTGGEHVTLAADQQNANRWVGFRAFNPSASAPYIALVSAFFLSGGPSSG